MTLNDVLAMPPAWTDRAACIGANPELFFPLPGYNATAAKALCAECPVRAACLDYALTNAESGVWGGMAEKERAGLHRGHRGATARRLDLRRSTRWPV